MNGEAGIRNDRHHVHDIDLSPLGGWKKESDSQDLSLPSLSLSTTMRVYAAAYTTSI